jgi:AraC family transcriptional regulator
MGPTELISPEQIPAWIPGELTLDSASAGWHGVSLRGYRYAGQEAEIPAMRDYMIVSYRKGVARMSRTDGGPWESARVEPGAVSILTRGERSRWRWDQPIEVSHMYLTQSAIERVAEDVFDRDFKTVSMPDTLRVDDPVLPRLACALETELNSGLVGSRLYADTIRTQLCIHLLRHHAELVFRGHAAPARARLSPAQRRLLCEYIDEHIDRALCLEDLAGVLRLGIWDFIRHFSAEFGCPPHAFVLRRRLEHAQRLLVRSDLPLKAVASDCGFADQSHMNRVFRRLLGTTPASLRRSGSGTGKTARGPADADG